MSDNTLYECNYYMDESCHLLNNNSKYMILGALSCPKKKAANISYKIKSLKKAHGLSADFEIKSTKISPAKYDFYKALIDLFLSEDDLFFRAVIIDKNQLDHSRFNQTHDDFYYKMVYNLFKYFLCGKINYIYIDYKDSMSYEKSQRVTQCLNNNHKMPPNYSFFAQPINSKESNILQLADLLIGLTSYNARGISSSKSKRDLIDCIEKNTGISMFDTTPYNINGKIDILNWRAR